MMRRQYACNRGIEQLNNSFSPLQRQHLILERSSNIMVVQDSSRIRVMGDKNSSSCGIILGNNSNINKHIASQHAWISVLLPRSSRKTTTRQHSQLGRTNASTTAMHNTSRLQHGSKNHQQQDDSQSRHKKQLWKPISPDREYSFKGTNTASSSILNNNNNNEAARTPRGRSSQRSKDDLIAALKAKHLMLLNHHHHHHNNHHHDHHEGTIMPPPPPPLFSAAAAVRSTTSAFPPPLGNSPPVPSEIVVIVHCNATTATTTKTTTATTTLKARDNVPSRIECFGATTPTPSAITTTIDFDNKEEDDDDLSEVSLDFDLLMMQLQLQTTLDASSSQSDEPLPSVSRNMDQEDGDGVACGSSSSEHTSGATHHYTDHPLFQTAGHVPQLVPPLSHDQFHNSVTRHDSVWGITTTTLDEYECNDHHDYDDASLGDQVPSDWPSDEEGAKRKQPEKIRTVARRRRRHTVCSSSSISSNEQQHEQKQVDTTPSPRDGGLYLSCSGFECWSSGDQLLLNTPALPSKKILHGQDKLLTPQSSSTALTAATTVTQASRDDDDDDGNNNQGLDRYRVSSVSINTNNNEHKRTSSAIAATWAYEEFALSRSHTGTTEGSSSVSSPMTNLTR